MARIFTDGATYKGRIISWTMGTAQSTGNEQIVWTFEPLARIEGGKEFPCPQHTRSIFRTFTDNTIEWIVRELKHLGYDRVTFDDLDPASPNAFDFKGKEILVKVKYENDQNGKERERWDMITPGSGPKINPMAANGMRKLNASFAAKLKTSLGSTTGNGSNGKVTPAKPAPSQLQKEAEETF